MPTIENEGYLTACLIYADSGNIDWETVQKVSGFGSEGGCKNKLSALKRKWTPHFEATLNGSEDGEITEIAAPPATPKATKKRVAQNDENDDDADAEESKATKKAVKPPKSPKTPNTPKAAKTPRGKKAKVEKDAEETPKVAADNHEDEA